MKNGVYLVGAGPGDIKLMTLRGLELLKECDAIVYDQLANPIFLTYTKKDCKRIYAGKKAGKHTIKQDDMNQLLLDLTKDYEVVVRLKGGDPYVFGRGSEEAEFLIDHEVHVEVVPGITSAIGGLASAGIPITARNIATSFHVITGHISKESEPVNYKALAKLKGTLVFLMGVRNLHHIVSELVNAGKDVETQVAIIYKATTPDEKVYTGSLATIEEIAIENQIKPPSLIVVGDVVKYKDILYSKSKNDLEGAGIVVTRSMDRISKFSDQLLEYGATVVPMSVIKFREINAEIELELIKQIETYSGIIFSSSIAVEILINKLFDTGQDVRSLMGKNIVAVGKETAKALKVYGIIADYIPENYSKEGIIKLFEDNKDLKGRYLLPRSKRSGSRWLEQLEKYIKIDVVDSYTTETDKEAYWDIASVKKANYITFTSSSTVEGFIERLRMEGIEPEEMTKGKKIVAIGPATSTTLMENEIQVHLMPEKATIKDMVACIVRDYKEVNDEV